MFVCILLLPYQHLTLAFDFWSFFLIIFIYQEQMMLKFESNIQVKFFFNLLKLKTLWGCDLKDLD